MYGWCGPANSSTVVASSTSSRGPIAEDPIGHLSDDAEIVGDGEHECRSVLALEAGEEVEELGLHRDVERSRRFVGDQQLRAQGQGHRQHDPLAHPAGELMGIIVDPSR